MGQTCCTTDTSSDIDQNIDTARPDRKNRDEIESSSDTERDQSHLSTEDQIIEKTPQPQHSSDDQEKAKKAFIEAIKSGNDTSAENFVQEYGELDLLQITFAGDDTVPDGDNCLQVAVRNKQYKLIVYLLNSGVSPNIQNKNNGDTALHTAVRTREINVVALLSKNNADPNIKNNNDETPSDIASENKDEDIVELLADDTQKLLKEVSLKVISEDATDDILADNDDVKADVVTAKPQKSPFAGLKRTGTQNALQGIQDVDDAKDTLPELSAWLEKKQSTMPYSWQKRWVVVKGSHLLWSDIQREIKDPKNIKERKKFNNSLNIMSISDVKPIKKGKTQRKWVMVVGDDKKKREYTWKCATEDDRNLWVDGLHKHIAQQKSVVVFLGAK